jgi:hypothetical protein
VTRQRLRAAAAALATLSLLADCAPSIRAVNPAPPGISYRLDDGSLDQLTQRAEQYCSGWGKHASLDGVSGEPDKIATFTCG